jgi:predicted nucleic acid-binding protein
MYILDTNILSELMDPEGASAVLVWADAVAPADQFTTAMSQAEVLYGLAVMPKGKRRTERIMWAEQMFAEDFPGRILPFEQRAAAHYADILSSRGSWGRRIDTIDAQIAAVARATGMAVVTRNVRDFQHCGIDLINPWDT